jgi:branched-chain amino acid transport system substrate-binding protein
MTYNNRRSVLKGGAAMAAALAVAFPSIVRAQADKIKIGHLTPLTGFPLGAYAQLGIRMCRSTTRRWSIR